MILRGRKYDTSSYDCNNWCRKTIFRDSQKTCHLVTPSSEMPINTGESESDMLLKHVTPLVTPHLTFGRRKVEGGRWKVEGGGRREEGGRRKD